MRPLVVSLLLTACSVVPPDRGPTDHDVLEARLEALEARSVALEARAEALETRAEALEAREQPSHGRSAGLPPGALRERREARSSRTVSRKQHLARFEGTVDELASSDLDSLGRILLHRGPDGAFDGYRLSGIRSNSLAEQLGLHNGDVVHSVNGHPLRSMTEAMHAIEAVRDDDTLRLDVTRRGERIDLTVVLTN